MNPRLALASGEPPPPTEQEFQQHLRVALCKLPGVRVWRQPAGKVRTDRGTWVECAPVGAADLSGIVGPEGWRLEVEVKGARTPVTEEQRSWQRAQLALGAIALQVRYDATASLETNCARVVALVRGEIAARRGGPGA